MLRRVTGAAKATWSVLAGTFHDWRQDHASLMAASLAFYTLVSIAPLLIIFISVGSSLFPPEQVEASVTQAMTTILGEEAAGRLRGFVGSASLQGTRWTATALSLVIVLYGSTRVFGELQRSLRVVFREPGASPIGLHPLVWLRTYAASFLMVVGVGLLWLSGIVSSTIISAIDRWMRDRISAGLKVAGFIQITASVVLLTLALLLMYRLLSGGKARWRDATLGALLTAILITLGQKLIGALLVDASISSVYGAAGSIVVVLFWFYYSWMIVLLGAEFTKVFAAHRTRPAEAESERAPAQRGLRRRA